MELAGGASPQGAPFRPLKQPSVLGKATNAESRQENVADLGSAGAGRMKHPARCAAAVRATRSIDSPGRGGADATLLSKARGPGNRALVLAPDLHAATQYLRRYSSYPTCKQLGRRVGRAPRAPHQSHPVWQFMPASGRMRTRASRSAQTLES